MSYVFGFKENNEQCLQRSGYYNSRTITEFRAASHTSIVQLVKTLLLYLMSFHRIQDSGGEKNELFKFCVSALPWNFCASKRPHFCFEGTDLLWGDSSSPMSLAPVWMFIICSSIKPLVSACSAWVWMLTANPAIFLGNLGEFLKFSTLHALMSRAAHLYKEALHWGMGTTWWIRHCLHPHGVS